MMYREVKASERLPAAYEEGAWDGKRSDHVTIKTANDTYMSAVLYSGFMDGSEFNDWFDFNGYEICEKVIAWLEPIEITEDEIENMFHNEYSTPKDENYPIEYDAYMAGAKAILSKLKGE